MAGDIADLETVAVVVRRITANCLAALFGAAFFSGRLRESLRAEGRIRSRLVG